MKKKTVHWSVIFYLLIMGLVYVPTISLWGNMPALRTLHVDLPPSASDADFQIKALANFLAGVVILTGCVGLLKRQDWGRPVTVLGLLCQMSIYVAEVVIYRYLNALGAAAVVIPLDIAIIIFFTHGKERLNVNRQ